MFTIDKEKKKFNATDVTTPMTNKQTSERGSYGYGEWYPKGNDRTAGAFFFIS
jgi:hypothetical protein